MTIKKCDQVIVSNYPFEKLTKFWIKLVFRFDFILLLLKLTQTDTDTHTRKHIPTPKCCARVSTNIPLMYICSNSHISSPAIIYVQVNLFLNISLYNSMLNIFSDILQSIQCIITCSVVMIFYSNIPIIIDYPLS